MNEALAAVALFLNVDLGQRGQVYELVCAVYETDWGGGADDACSPPIPVKAAQGAATSSGREHKRATSR